MKSTVLKIGLLTVCAYIPLAVMGEAAPDSLHSATHHLDEVVVSGVAGSVLQRQSSAPVSVVSHKTLDSKSATNIIDAIASQPGISQLTTGSGISKPIIRGLGYNRLIVVNNGLRQEGQQWGDEHGIEADAASVGSVEILKGPASLAYGSDAMAGVIVLRPHPVPEIESFNLDASTEYQSDNGLLGLSATASGRGDKLFWRVGASGKTTHDMRVPDEGYVAGSAFRDCGLNAMAGITDRWGISRLSLTYYHLRPGMIEGEDEPGSHSYSISAPYQLIDHTSVSWDNSINIGEGHLKAIIGWQRNSRQEFEEEDEPGLHLLLNTVNYNLAYQISDIADSGVGYQGGVSGMWQESDNRGDEFLIPDYRLFDIGAFSAIQREFNGILLNGGLRYNFRHVTSNLLIDDGDVRFDAFTRSFSALTGSVGISIPLARHHNLKLNAACGFRAPNISELASNGVHEGTQHYELGNSHLRSEKSMQFDFGYEYGCDLWRFELSCFFNDISDYIFLRRAGHAADMLPLYEFTQGHARLWGGEMALDIHPLSHLHLLNEFSIVKSRLLHQERDARYLPFTPAPRLRSELRYDLIHSHHSHADHAISNLWLSVNEEVCLRQNDCYLAGGTETPTAAYALLGADIGTDLNLGSNTDCSIYLSGSNLLNRRYFSHTSRLKYIGDGIPNPGRNLCIKFVLHI